MSQQARQNQRSQQREDQLNLPVGEILRRTRLHYGLTLADVEKALRIRACQLGAIEEGRTDLLPGRVYAIGFVRSYSEYLGLDGGKIVTMFKRQSAGVVERPELSLPVPASESKVPSVYVLVASLTVALAVVISAFIFALPRERGEIPPVPEIVKAEKAEAVPEDAAPSAVSADATAALAPASGEPQSRLTLTALDNVWVEIRTDEGKSLLSRILKPGDKYLVPDREGLIMDTGNAGALQVAVDGFEAMPLGADGDVLRKVALNPDDFLARSKRAAAAAGKVSGEESQEKGSEEEAESAPASAAPE